MKSIGWSEKSGHPRKSMGVRFFGPPCRDCKSYSVDSIQARDDCCYFAWMQLQRTAKLYAAVESGLSARRQRLVYKDARLSNAPTTRPARRIDWSLRSSVRSATSLGLVAASCHQHRTVVVTWPAGDQPWCLEYDGMVRWGGTRHWFKNGQTGHAPRGLHVHFMEKREHS